MTDDDKLRAAVERMFDDHSFKRVTNSIWLHGAVIDDVRVGVIEATYNQNFGNFTLNCNEFKRLIDAKSRAGPVQPMWSRVATTHRPLKGWSSRSSRPPR